MSQGPEPSLIVAVALDVFAHSVGPEHCPLLTGLQAELAARVQAWPKTLDRAFAYVRQVQVPQGAIGAYGSTSDFRARLPEQEREG